MLREAVQASAKRPARYCWLLPVPRGSAALPSHRRQPSPPACLQRSAQLYASAAKADPRDDRTWLQWGLLERRRGQLEAAERCFERGVKASPRNPYLWQVGLGRNRAGHAHGPRPPLLARSWCLPHGCVHALFPWLLPPQVYGVLLFQQGRDQEARQVLRQGVSFNPSNPQVRRRHRRCAHLDGPHWGHRLAGKLAGEGSTLVPHTIPPQWHCGGPSLAALLLFCSCAWNGRWRSRLQATLVSWNSLVLLKTNSPRLQGCPWETACSPACPPARPH